MVRDESGRYAKRLVCFEKLSVVHVEPGNMEFDLEFAARTKPGLARARVALAFLLQHALPLVLR